MGATESTLKPQTVKSLVRPDSITPLPSFALDSVKFTDGTVGFLVTKVDLAKNTTTQIIPLKLVFQTADTGYTFVGRDDTLVQFVRDKLSGKVFCTVNSSSGIYVRQCVTIYERLEDAQIDLIERLYSVTS